MNFYSTAEELEEDLERSGVIRREGSLVIASPDRFRTQTIDGLVWTAVFGVREVKAAARSAIRQAEASRSIREESILPLREARGRGEIAGFTVPAVNFRLLAYE